MKYIPAWFKVWLYVFLVFFVAATVFSAGIYVLYSLFEIITEEFSKFWGIMFAIGSGVFLVSVPVSYSVYQDFLFKERFGISKKFAKECFK